MSYIYKGVVHKDTSAEYLSGLGMDSDAVESVQNQELFERHQVASNEQDWVKSELAKCDVEMQKIVDGDQRVECTADSLSEYRVSLRDYVRKDKKGELYVATEKPAFNFK